MDWWKRKKSRAYEEKQRLIRGRERGAMLLEDLIKCCDGKSNPIKFFSAENLDSHHMILFVNKFWPLHDVVLREVRDITISSMVSGHKNFMKLVGCCLEIEIPFMVYHGERKQYSRLDLKMVVSWKKRMKIAEDIATALAYLHTAFPRPFLHCNMGLQNILLDQDDVAKLIDFSNCVSIPQGETFVKVPIWATRDYMDYDYITNGVLSEKTDAFGIGILMQKLLTGQERFHQLYGSNGWNSLPTRNSRWLSEFIGQGRMNEIVDPNMLEKMGQFSEEERCRMEAFVILSERCIGLRGEVPKMVQVAKELKKILQTTSSSPSGETQISSSSILLSNQT